MKHNPSEPVRDVLIVELIAVTFIIGEGIDNSDPVRKVTAFYTFDGERVAFSDPWLAARPMPVKTT